MSAVRTTYSWQSTSTVICLFFLPFSTVEPQATEFSEIIVPNCGLPASARIGSSRRTAATKSGFFMGAPWTKFDAGLVSFQCKCKASENGGARRAREPKGKRSRRCCEERQRKRCSLNGGHYKSNKRSA